MQTILATFRGEKPLPVTYWLWFALPIFALNCVVWLVDAIAKGSPMAVVTNPYLFLWIVIGAIVLQVITVFGSGTAVIRSAFKRAPRDAWAYLAIAIVVLGMVRLPLQLLDVMNQPSDAPKQAVATAVKSSGDVQAMQSYVLKSIKANLPVKREEGEIYDATFEGTTLVYHVRMTATAPDFVLDVARTKEAAFANRCKYLQKIFVLKAVEATRNSYEFSNGTTGSYTVDRTECGIDDHGRQTLPVAMKPAAPAGDKPALTAETKPAKGQSNFLKSFEDMGIQIQR